MPAYSRREFLTHTVRSGALLGTGLGGCLAAARAPAVVAAPAAVPRTDWGLQTGDVRADRAIVWSRTDRPARMLVEWARNERFVDAVRVPGPYALPASDYTARLDLAGLPEDADVFVRVVFEDLAGGRGRSAPLGGRFRTAAAADGPAAVGPVRFVWSGDTAGQGYGIDLDFGGMSIYETMRAAEPLFFLHSGDTVYADGPMTAGPFETPDGATWTNAYLDAVPEKLKVAETQREFHRNYLYNLYDANVRRFNAEVPQIWQWDDHEVTNNWSDAKDLSDDDRYTEKSVPLLTARGSRAFLDYAPLRWHDQRESGRVYRRFGYGDALDVFVVDMRSYRGPNSANLQSRPGPDTALFGETQLAWLMRGLLESRATWKVIASDMPLGLCVADGPRWEAAANGDDGGALGRELEIARLLRFLQAHRVRNTVWLTADVHYTAAHYYDPAKARFQKFDPFWEFVSGPLNSGNFGPNALDGTFGPQVVFAKAPPAGGSLNLSPRAGLQFFGQVDIEGPGGTLTVALKDAAGATLHSQVLEPQV